VPKGGLEPPRVSPPPAQDGVSDDEWCPYLRPLRFFEGIGKAPLLESLVRLIPRLADFIETVLFAFQFRLVQVLRKLLALGQGVDALWMSAIIFPRRQESHPYILFLRGFLPLGEPTSRGRT